MIRPSVLDKLEACLHYLGCVLDKLEAYPHYLGCVLDKLEACPHYCRTIYWTSWKLVPTF